MRRPEAPAASDGEVTLTYGELLAAAARLGDALEARPRAGELVGVLASRAAWLPAAMLACFRAGVPFVALDPRDPPERQRRILEGAGVDLLITDVLGGEVAAGFDRPLDLAAAFDPAVAVDVLRGAHGDVAAPAVVIFTSGSTGAPKGVVNSQAAILQRAAQYVAACGVTAEDVFLPLGGLVTIAGYREIFTALLSGAALHLVRPQHAGVRGLRELVARVRPTLIYTVPSILRVVLSADAAEAFAGLRVLRIGGEEIRWTDIELARRALPAGCAVQIGYSSTETTGAQWFVPRDYPPDAGAVPVGYVLPGAQFAIVGEEPDGPGELFIRSPFVALGEWRDGTLHATPADSADPALRVHATGDLMRMDPDGLLHFAGRNDRQVKINGVRFETAELEHQLRQAGGVEDVGVVVSPTGGLVAFAALPEGDRQTEERRLREHLREVLPGGLQPARLHILPAIPRLSSGKVDQRQLQRLDEAALAAAPPLAPTPPDGRIEQAVAAAWSLFLPQSRRLDAAWDAEGGDSLKLLNFVLELERTLGAPLPLDGFRTDMTRDDFARLADGLVRQAPVHPVCATRPTVFFFPGMHGDVPASARFRARLAAEAAFVVLRYPGLEAIAEQPPAIADLARAFADDIMLVQPEGPLHLAGYSLGAGVAVEAAAQLARRGRRIAFLVVLDSDISVGVEKEPGVARLRRLAARRGQLPAIAYRNLVGALARLAERLGLRASLPRLLARAPLTPHMRASLALQIEGDFRVRALRAWVQAQREPLPLGGVVFRSQEPRPGAPADLGWRRILRPLRVEPFGGDHVGAMGDEAYAPGNAARFLAALRRAQAG